jgi:hypothetical protein
VVALDEDGFGHLFEFDQTIYYTARIRAPIDIVAKKDTEVPRAGPLCKVVVDPAVDQVKEIEAAVDITHGVATDIPRETESRRQNAIGRVVHRGRFRWYTGGLISPFVCLAEQSLRCLSDSRTRQ